MYCNLLLSLVLVLLAARAVAFAIKSTATQHSTLICSHVYDAALLRKAYAVDDG
jgi:hypothetical protein